MTHPLHKLVKSCMRGQVKHHPSLLHILLCTFGTKPDVIETIAPAAPCPNVPNTFTTEVATSCDKSKKDDQTDQSDIWIYTNGSGADCTAGTSAILYRGNHLASLLPYCLGSLDEHTMYEAKGIGVILALELLQREWGMQYAIICLDNQRVIQSIRHIHLHPGQKILCTINEMENHLSNPLSQRHVTLRITQISGHDNVEGNEEADRVAKEVSKAKAVVSTFYHPSSPKQVFHTASWPFIKASKLHQADNGKTTGKPHLAMLGWQTSTPPSPPKKSKTCEWPHQSTEQSSNADENQSHLVQQVFTAHQKFPSPLCPSLLPTNQQNGPPLPVQMPHTWACQNKDHTHARLQLEVPMSLVKHIQRNESSSAICGGNRAI